MMSVDRICTSCFLHTIYVLYQSPVTDSEYDYM